MKPLTSAEAKKWCQAQGVRLAGGHLHAGKPKTFSIPSNAGRRVALVKDHLERFRGSKALVRFDQWGVWPSGERMHVFERFLASYGETRPLNEISSFLFATDEHEDLVSFVTIGVLFLWDVHVIASRAKHLLYYSHDEHGWME
jgi:hypothetical protein